MLDDVWMRLSRPNEVIGRRLPFESELFFEFHHESPTTTYVINFYNAQRKFVTWHLCLAQLQFLQENANGDDAARSSWNGSLWVVQKLISDSSKDDFSRPYHPRYREPQLTEWERRFLDLHEPKQRRALQDLCQAGAFHDPETSKPIAWRCKITYSTADANWRVAATHIGFGGLGFLVDLGQELSFAYLSGEEEDSSPRHVSAACELFFVPPMYTFNADNEDMFPPRGRLLNGCHWSKQPEVKAAFSAAAAEEEDCSD
jgi:hypothetical protein